MTGIEYKAGDWEIKALDDAGNFSVYFAAFENIDRGGDCIEAGSFKNLTDYDRSGWIGVNHCMDELPVAYPTAVKQDATGLMVGGRFHSTPAGQACRTVVKERMAAGKAVFGSIGYKVNPGGAHVEYKDGKSIRRITSLDLFECSFVNLPMNPLAETVSAKSLEGLEMDEKVMTIEALKAWLEEQTKAGRVLSKSNHATLKGWHGTLSTMCSDMKAMVDAFDPDRAKPDDEPDGDEKAAVGVPPKYRDGDKAVDQRNAAGNSIPAAQNPRGAVIAAEFPGKSLAEWQRQRQKQLDDLRARVLQDQARFAGLRS